MAITPQVNVKNRLSPYFSDKFKIEIRPYFDIYCKQWQFYLDSYIGGYQYIQNENYLHRHEHEYKEEFDFRKKLSCYTNPCHSIIMNIDKHIFGEDIERKGIEKFIDLISFQNLSRKEVGINKCFSYNARYILALGEIFFLIDAPQGTSGYTDQQVKDLNLKWTCYPILPQYVPALEMNKGKVEKIVIECNTPTGERDETGNQINITQIYFDSEKIIYVYDRGKQPTEQPNKFGKVPIIRFLIDEDNNEFGESLIRDIAPVSNTIFNLDNLKSYIEYSSAFPYIGLPVTDEFYNIAGRMYGDALIKMREYKENAEGKFDLHTKDVVGVDFRLKRIMTYDSNGDIKILNLNHEILDKIQNDINYKENKIKEMASQRVQELIRQSGIAKRYDYLDEVTQLKYLSSIFKSFEEEFWKMFFDLSQTTLDMDSVQLSYPTRFDVIDRDKVVEQLILYKDNVVSQTAKKEADKLMTDVMLKGYISDDKLVEIKGEIDKEETMSKQIPEQPIKENIDFENIEFPLSEEEKTMEIEET